MTFELGVVGYQKNLKIKETELIASEGFFRAQISFTQGEEFEMSGFEDVEHAYNRDFFSYNPDNGKFTFLRKSGTWEILIILLSIIISGWHGWVIRSHLLLAGRTRIYMRTRLE